MKMLIEVEGERQQILAALSAAEVSVGLIIEDPEPPRSCLNSAGGTIQNPDWIDWANRQGARNNALKLTAA